MDLITTQLFNVPNLAPETDRVDILVRSNPGHSRHRERVTDQRLPVQVLVPGVPCKASLFEVGVTGADVGSVRLLLSLCMKREISKGLGRAFR